MRENRDLVVSVNILTPFARAPFFWAVRHTTVCLDTEYTILAWSFNVVVEYVVVKYSKILMHALN